MTTTQAATKRGNFAELYQPLDTSIGEARSRAEIITSRAQRWAWNLYKELCPDPLANMRLINTNPKSHLSWLAPKLLAIAHWVRDQQQRRDATCPQQPEG